MGFFTDPFPDILRGMALLGFFVTLFVAERRAISRLGQVRDQIGNPELPKITSMMRLTTRYTLQRQSGSLAGRQLLDAYLRESALFARTLGRILLVVVPIGLLSYL